MKKRLLSLFLAVWTAAALLCAPASALFDDIPDAQTASAVEVLRFMGVLDGYSDGTFRPDAQLNRAQFCKMVVNAIGREKELGSYAAMTIFPDVRASHWAAPYINLAARGEKIISGYADGNFHPERPVTLGQAAAILLRLLGYKDENIRGLWPYGHVAQADAIGLLDSGLKDLCDVTVAVIAPRKDRLLRIMARDGISEEYARLRISAQQPAEYFSARCDYTLCNDGTLAEMEEKCEKLFTEVCIDV